MYDSEVPIVILDGYDSQVNTAILDIYCTQVHISILESSQVKVQQQQIVMSHVHTDIEYGYTAIKGVYDSQICTN